MAKPRGIFAIAIEDRFKCNRVAIKNPFPACCDPIALSESGLKPIHVPQTTCDELLFALNVQGGPTIMSTLNRLSVSTLLSAPVVALVALTAVFSLGAHAQDAQKAAYLSTISVTAAKRDVALKEATTAIRIIDSEELEDAGINHVLDLDKLIPGLQINKQSTGAYSGITLRGVSPTDFYTPSVVVYVDGVARDPSFIDRGLGDVERVEVLKGPQGSLYGRNAYAGVINIITRKPDNQRRGVVKIRAAQLDRQTEAGFAGPVVEDLLFASATVRGIDVQAEADNTENGDKNIDDGNSRHISGKIRLTPLDGRLDMTLAGLYETEDAEEVFFTEQNYRKRDAAGTNLFGRVLTDRTERKYRQGSLSVGCDFDDFSLQSVTGFQNRDMDRSIFMRQNEAQTGYSEELRITYAPQGSRLTGVAGVFADHTEFERDAQTSRMRNYINKIGLKSYAAFTEGSYQVTDRFAVTMGGRYSYDKAGIDLDGKDGLPSLNKGDSWSHFSPKLAGSYQWSPTLSQFAAISSGYKPGGFNRTVTGTGSAANIPYEQETSWNYETGLRAALFGEKVTASASVYYKDISDIQLYTGAGGGQYVLRNFDGAKSYGIEAETGLYLLEDLDILAGIHYGRSDLETNTKTTNGNRLPYAPQLSGNLGLQHYFTAGLMTRPIIARADLSYFGHTKLDVNNHFAQSGYTIVDLRLGYEWNGVTLTGFLNNALDRNYKVYATQSGSLVGVQPGEGRNGGIEVSLKF